MNNTGQDLVKRIANLVRQNQDLTKDNETLKEELRELTTELEFYKKGFSGSKSDLIKGKILVEKASPLRFDIATVMFANIHGFENIEEGMNSAEVMDDLDSILFQFDEILRKYKIQKIKTIGDTIMAAGGVPKKNITNPVDVIMAAIEMQNFLKEHCEKHSPEKKIWELKIGIHTGPVTATTSGKKKITYDIKGDVVNMATRMQYYTYDGAILISVMTYELTKEFFQCEYYGKMPVKYKTDLEIFKVKALKPEFSLDEEGTQPNENFGVKFKLIQFNDIQEIILDKLEKELPASLYYHNVKHTVDVVTEVELMGWAESVTDEEILLLKTAGLFHDAGHTVAYDEHEYHGTVLVREMLPKYGYTEDQINRICDIIMATKLPPQPKDLLQKIICDADLDYLGRSDMIPVSNTLYEELKEQNKIGTIDDWNRLQIMFISGHQYFTQTARSLREVNKQKQIERIKNLLPKDEE